MEAKRKTTKELVLLGQAGLSKPAIDAQVELLCSSRAFDDGDQARDLLRYLVKEAYAGRVPYAADIALALHKLDFGPRDPYVRSAKKRLCERMEHHYAQLAKPSEIHFVIPDRDYFVLAPRSTERSVNADSPTVAAILAPPESSEVYQRVMMRGRIDLLDPDFRVWLVVLASDGFYYPQCRVSRRSPSWEYEVRVGRMQWGETDGVEFAILLIAADADGDFDFHGYMKRNGDGYGTRLPTDVKVLDTKRVVRRDIRPGGPTTDRLPPRHPKG